MHVKCIKLYTIPLHPGPVLVPEVIVVTQMYHPMVEKTTPATPRSKEIFVVGIQLHPSHFIRYMIHMHMLFH